MKKIENILKDTPEYESYSENEVKLTVGEMKELGGFSCSKGCCSKGSNNSNRSCCKKNVGIGLQTNGCCNGNSCCGKK